MPVNQERFGLSQRWEKNNEIGEVIVVRREREKRNADVNNFEKKIHLTSCPFFMVHTPRDTLLHFEQFICRVVSLRFSYGKK